MASNKKLSTANAVKKGKGDNRLIIAAVVLLVVGLVIAFAAPFVFPEGTAEPIDATVQGSDGKYSAVATITNVKLLPNTNSCTVYFSFSNSYGEESSSSYTCQIGSNSLIEGLEKGDRITVKYAYDTPPAIDGDTLVLSAYIPVRGEASSWKWITMMTVGLVIAGVGIALVIVTVFRPEKKHGKR